jgi:hypothetical protein
LKPGSGEDEFTSSMAGVSLKVILVNELFLLAARGERRRGFELGASS